MSSFLTEQIDLSMCSTQTGLPLTANVYTHVDEDQILEAGRLINE